MIFFVSVMAKTTRFACSSVSPYWCNSRSTAQVHHPRMRWSSNNLYPGMSGHWSHANFLQVCSVGMASCQWEPKLKYAILARDREWMCMAVDQGHGRLAEDQARAPRTGLTSCRPSMDLTGCDGCAGKHGCRYTLAERNNSHTDWGGRRRWLQTCDGWELLHSPDACEPCGHQNGILHIVSHATHFAMSAALL